LSILEKFWSRQQRNSISYHYDKLRNKKTPLSLRSCLKKSKQFLVSNCISCHKKADHDWSSKLCKGESSCI